MGSGRRELTEQNLLQLLNNYWSQASFGYPIHEELRAPTSVAESLRTDYQNYHSEAALKDELANKMGTDEVRRMLELSVKLYRQPELLNEYDSMRKQQFMQQRELVPRSAAKDPLAEFEELFYRWKRCQHKIKKLIFPVEKQLEVQEYQKQELAVYLRALELDEALKYERDRRQTQSSSPAHKQASQRSFERYAHTAIAARQHHEITENNEEETGSEHVHPFLLNSWHDSTLSQCTNLAKDFKQPAGSALEKNLDYIRRRRSSAKLNEESKSNMKKRSHDNAFFKIAIDKNDSTVAQRGVNLASQD